LNSGFFFLSHHVTTTPQHHNTTTPQHHNTTTPQHHNSTTPNTTTPLWLHHKDATRVRTRFRMALAKAQAYVAEAEKKKKGGWFSGPRFDEASENYASAANCMKMAKDRSFRALCVSSPPLPLSPSRPNASTREEKRREDRV